MSEVAQTRDQFGRRLKVALHDGLDRLGIDAEVETEPVRFTRLHRALVTSKQFSEMGQLERQEVMWRIVQSALSPDDQLRISMIVALTPDELGDEAAA